MTHGHIYYAIISDNCPHLLVHAQVAHRHQELITIAGGILGSSAQLGVSQKLSMDGKILGTWWFSGDFMVVQWDFFWDLLGFSVMKKTAMEK